MTVSEKVQLLASVVETIYSVESVGQARGSAMLVALRLSEGDQT